MTPEGKLKKEVKAYLKSLNAYFFMPVQTGYGATTLDFLVCINGRFVAIETKAPGRWPTLRQDRVIREIIQAGGIAFATDSLERTKKYIEDHVLGKYQPDRE